MMKIRLFTLNMPQKISEVNLDSIEGDSALESIFANADPDEYFDKVLHLCIRRGRMIQEVRSIINRR